MSSSHTHGARLNRWSRGIYCRRSAALAAALLLALTLAGTAAAQSATVMTDQADYAPGTIVTITGSGWQPGETVTLSFVESPLLDTHPDLTAVADPSGNIFNNQFSPDSHDINITFTLTATGGTSGLQAQTTFTDNVQTIGSLAVFTNSNCSGTGPYVAGNAATACATGMSFSGQDQFSLQLLNPSNAQVICTSVNGTGSSGSATGSATFSGSLITIAGTWTVKAFSNTNCTGQLAGGSNTATFLVVAGSASKLVFTSTAVTVAAGMCSSALTVQSQDSSGNSSNVSSTETLAPSASPSAGASFYTDDTCTTAVTGSNLTIASGSNSASFFFKDTVAGSVVITVMGTGAFTANGANAATQTETVNAAVVRRGQTIVASLSPKDWYTVMALQKRTKDEAL